MVDSLVVHMASLLVTYALKHWCVLFLTFVKLLNFIETIEA